MAIDRDSLDRATQGAVAALGFYAQLTERDPARMPKGRAEVFRLWAEFDHKWERKPGLEWRKKKAAHIQFCGKVAALTRPDSAVGKAEQTQVHALATFARDIGPTIREAEPLFNLAEKPSERTVVQGIGGNDPGLWPAESGPLFDPKTGNIDPKALEAYRHRQFGVVATNAHAAVLGLAERLLRNVMVYGDGIEWPNTPSPEYVTEMFARPDLRLGYWVTIRIEGQPTNAAELYAQLQRERAAAMQAIESTGPAVLPAESSKLHDGKLEARTGQGDKKGDKKKIPPRPLNAGALACITTYKRARKADAKRPSMKAICREYADKHSDSFDSLYRTLKDHSSEWKGDKKGDNPI